MAVSSPTASRIVIVDDHPIVLRGMVQILHVEEDLRVVATAETPAEARASIEEHEPDLVIVDVALKNSSGLDLVKEFRTQHPTLPILLLSMHEESVYAERALRAGARGYIMKREAPEQLVHAVRAVLRGEIYLSDRMVTRILHKFVSGRGTGQGNALDSLTDRELEVFRLMGQGFGTREIAERLSLSIKTIETYRSHVKEKLGLANGAELVRYAMRWVQSENLS